MHTKLVLPLLLVVAVFLTACGGQADSFVPLPPPVGRQHVMNVITQSVGDTEDVTAISPEASIIYGQTGDSTGGMKVEELCLKQVKDYSICSTMLSTNWGTYLKAEFEHSEAYDPEGQLLGGWIEQKLPEANILQFLAGCASCTVNKSRLIFEYTSEEPGSWPELAKVYYFVEWGTSSRNPLAFGTAHVWATDVATLFPAQSEWGYWETKKSPFKQVQEGLALAQTVLKEVPATLAVVDHDSAGREFLGRQTGFTIKRNGKETGSVVLSYSNTWGVMPNTKLIGSGALSQVEWIEGTDYYAMKVLSPVLSPFPTSLYVFCSTQSCVDYIGDNQDEWPMLYHQIRQDSIEGLEFAVYSSGHVGSITDSTAEGTVDIGDGGGVHYSIIGSPNGEQIDEAYRYVSLLGHNGIKALGLYYATQPESGNGLEYYLAITRLVLAEDPLTSYGWDVGTLERVGFMPTD